MLFIERVYVWVFSSHITNRKPSWFECCYRSSFMFFYTFEAVFFDKILQSLYYAIAYIVQYTLYTICAIGLEATIRDKRSETLYFSISNVILACCFSFFLQKIQFRSRKRDTDWAILFRLACEITFCYYFVLFSFSFFSSSFCIISYSFALFLSSHSNHNEYSRFCFLFFSFPLWAKIKSSILHVCVCVWCVWQFQELLCSCKI